MAYWKIRYFPGIPLQEKNRKPTDIHEHKHSVTATSNLDLSLRGALHIYTVGSEVLKVTNHYDYCLQGRDVVWPEK
jgi:hypothetical protein